MRGDFARRKSSEVKYAEQDLTLVEDSKPAARFKERHGEELECKVDVFITRRAAREKPCGVHVGSQSRIQLPRLLKSSSPLQLVQ